MNGPTRLEAVRLLLRQRSDYTPAPKIASWGARPGPASFGWIVCEHCQGDGCKRCYYRGSFQGDPYVGERIVGSRRSDASDVPWEQILNRVVRCSSCAGFNPLQCSRCNGSGVEDALLGGKADMTGLQRVLQETVERFEREAAMLSHPAQRALSGSLALLAASDPSARRLVAVVYESELESESSLPSLERVMLLHALISLAETMPSPLPKLPSELWASWASTRSALRRDVALDAARGKGSQGDRRARARRDEEIRRMYHDGGYSLRALGRRFGLTHKAVRSVIGEALPA